MKDDASRQPGNIQEVMLHETLVAWVRKKLQTSKPKSPWEETEEDYGERLKNIFRDINANCDIPGLCAEFPGRVQRVVDEKGGRISK